MPTLEIKPTHKAVCLRQEGYRSIRIKNADFQNVNLGQLVCILFDIE
jgi:hypothetical protein